MLKSIIKQIKESEITEGPSKKLKGRRPTRPSLMTLKDMQKKLEEMDDKKLKDWISDIFGSRYVDKWMLGQFLKDEFDENDLYNMSDKALDKMWDKLQTNLEKVLKKMKREDLLALKDKKTCVKYVKDAINDIESKFCEYIYITIWDNYKNKMFKNPKDVTDWMEEFRFCDALRDLKDDELCEIEQEGIKSIEIIDKGGDEHISVGSRASVFTVTYEIIINKHIKFEVSKSEINAI